MALERLIVLIIKLTKINFQKQVSRGTWLFTNLGVQYEEEAP